MGLSGRKEKRMITLCPDCQTAFRVTDAQLAAREGQVRCGACAHVFDARANLFTETQQAAPESATEPLPATDAIAEQDGPVEPGAEAPAPAEPVATESAFAAPAEPPPEDYEAPEATLPPPSELPFGPAATAPARRGPWVAGSIALVAVLFAQALFFFRNDIALLMPESKPLLAEVCATLGCAISLPQRSELMSIEASDLQADAANPNVVILTATLRNRAAFAQAHPALELTLTDAQDLPLARRVLQAGDYIESAPDREAGFAAGAERAIKLTLQLADIKATGYRLYLFYP
jgi:predicted Zn finger-like uncharacterized protein